MRGGEELPKLPHLPKHKTADDFVWGSKGKEARMLAKFQSMFSLMEEGDRGLLLSMAQKMASRKGLDTYAEQYDVQRTLPPHTQYHRFVLIPKGRINLTAQLAAVRPAKITLRRLKILVPEPCLHGAKRYSVLVPVGRACLAKAM